MLPIIAALVQAGLGITAKAVAVKGQEWLEEKTGIKVDLSSGEIPAEQLAVLRQAEMDHEAEMLRIATTAAQASADSEVEVIKTVNSTIQAEGKSEYWPQWAWRPYIGASFGTYINSLWILPMFDKTPVILTTEMVLAIGGILGVASWFRGKTQQMGALK